MRDFANFGSLILGIVADARFRLFGKRARCAIALILEFAAESRFHLAGKRNH